MKNTLRHTTRLVCATFALAFLMNAGANNAARAQAPAYTVGPRSATRKGWVSSMRSTGRAK